MVLVCCMLFFAYLCAMKRKYLLCLWVAIASVMTSCEDAQLDDGLCSSKHFPRTVIVYMAAENSLARYVATDSVEISKALSDIDENARVVLYIDDTKRGGSRICAGSRNFPMRQVKTYDRNICSTDSADMSMVLHDIVRSFPSETYGLVFWSHASGWLFPSEGDTIIGRSSRRNSFGIDNGHRSTSDYGEKMSIPTLQNVLTTLPHFDFIFFDACFMQCVEVAYQLRSVCDYMLGSPAEIPGTGAPYQELIPALCSPAFDPDASLLKYFDYYNGGFNSHLYSGVELSSVRTSGLEALAEATRPLVTRLFSDPQALRLYDVQKYRPGNSYDQYPEFYDMRHLFALRATPEEFAAWDSVYQSVVTYHLSDIWYSAIPSGHFEVMRDVSKSGGLSIFVPLEKYIDNGWAEDYKKLDWYKKTKE